MSIVTLGSDPEVFALKEDKVLPGYYALGGDKDILLPNGTAYPDGAAVEFTVNPTSHTGNFTEYVWGNLIELKYYLSQRGCTLWLKSNEDVSEYIPKLPEVYGKRASLQILGCNEDIRIYDWVQDIARPNPKTYPFRTIGTHIHLGIGEFTKDWAVVQFIVATLDAILGTAGVFVLDGDVAAKERMKLYGRSGTIRIKKLEEDGFDGIEYRTLPSQAVLNSYESVYYFYSTAQQIADVVLDFYLSENLDMLLQFLGGIEGLHQLTGAIDSFDAETCRQIQARVAEALELDVRFFQESLIARYTI